MNCTIIAARSTDGYIAGPHGDISWVSPEDAEFLRSVVQKNDVLIMGSTTYQKHRSNAFGKDGKRRIVLTTKTANYAAYVDEAQFVRADLTTILKELEFEKVENVLIMGGSKLYTDAVQHMLADTIYVTVEPVALGSGTHFLNDLDYVHLKGYELANERMLSIAGTKILTYKKAS